MNAKRRPYALVVVDMQNDFVAPAGSLSVAGALNILPTVNATIRQALGDDALVIYTADWHPAETSHFAAFGGIWPSHCVANTWGAEFHPELVLAGTVVPKGRNGEDGYSGFTMRRLDSDEMVPTELASILRRNDIDTVRVIGVATDYCVKATAIDAADLGFATAVLTNAIAAVDLAAGDGDAALAEMAAAGVELV